LRLDDSALAFAEWPACPPGHYELSLICDDINEIRTIAVMPQYFSENDLQYRSALRNPDVIERNRLQNVLQARLLGISEREESVGKRAEFQVIWWLRNLVREQGIDHLVSVEHSTVRDDLTGGSDIVIRTLSWGTIGIQLKALLRDSNTDAYNNELMKKARAEAARTGTSVTEFGSDDLRTLVRAEMEGKPDVKLRNKLLALAELEVPNSGKGLFALLREKPKVDLSQTIQLPMEKKPVGVITRRIARPKQE